MYIFYGLDYQRGDNPYLQNLFVNLMKKLAENHLNTGLSPLFWGRTVSKLKTNNYQRQSKVLT